MKNKTNVGSFVIAKFQAKRRNLLATQIRRVCAIALVAVIGFTMAGCKNGTTSSNPDDPVLPPPPPGFSVSGKFNKSVSEEVKFKLTETTEALSVLKTRSARAVSTEKVISGVIDDGDFTIRLSGIYNSDTGSYTASASASIIRYTINGVIDESGDSIGSTATLLVKDGENWKTTTYVITEAPVTISGTAVDSVAGGLPEFARGVWKFIDSSDDVTSDNTLTVNQWDVNYFLVTTYGDERTTDVQRYSVVKIDNSGDNYDVIFAFPLYKGTKAQVAAAVKEFFSANGITIPEADLSESKPDASTLFFGIDNFNNESFDVYDVRFNCVTEAQWKVVDKFYRTNAVDAYLIRAGVAPTTWFGKYRITFSNGNAKLTWTPYMTMSASTFETLAEAEALTVEDNLFVDFYATEFTR